MSVEVGKIQIFKNDDATPENRRPLFNIKFSMNGTDYSASLWRSTTKEGKPYYNGKIEQFTQLQSVPNPPAKSTRKATHDDIPF